MKRRRGITEDELNQVIKLREAGANWLTIQKETEIPRRSAKLFYEKWKKSMVKWIIKYGSEECNSLLENRWEPFAVTCPGLGNLSTIWLRRISTKGGD